MYNIKYRQCLARAVMVMKNYLIQIFVAATDQVIESKNLAKAGEQLLKSIKKVVSLWIYWLLDDKSADTAFAIYYGKFQASAPKAKRITSVIEERLDRSNEYEQLLIELHQSYLSQRATVRGTECKDRI